MFLPFQISFSLRFISLHRPEFAEVGGSSLFLLVEERGFKQPCCEYSGQNEDLILDRDGKVTAKGASPFPVQQGISVFSPHI